MSKRDFDCYRCQHLKYPMFCEKAYRYVGMKTKQTPDWCPEKDKTNATAK